MDIDTCQVIIFKKISFINKDVDSEFQFRFER